MVRARKKEGEGMRLGKYELGKTLGEGNFGKVKYATNVETGQPYAVKILEKKRIVELNITDQVNFRNFHQHHFILYLLLLFMFVVLIRYVCLIAADY